MGEKGVRTGREGGGNWERKGWELKEHSWEQCREM